jgi:hypothetical protein
VETRRKQVDKQGGGRVMREGLVDWEGVEGDLEGKDADEETD